MAEEDIHSRVKLYIENVKLVLDKLKERSDLEKYRGVIEAAELYMKDAEYYLEERKDAFTALACIAYAEGLIDSLRYLGVADVEWGTPTQLLARPRVLVAGSFEIVHPGHIHYLREAWRLGRVYAIVASDEGIRRFKKREPIVPEEQRLRVIESIRYVYKALLGDRKDYLRPVVDVKPDIILLGPDQWPDEDKLREELEKRGVRGVVIKRLRERVNEGLYSTSRIIKEIISRYCRRS